MRGAIREDDYSPIIIPGCAPKSAPNPQDDPYNDPDLKRPANHFFDPVNNRPLETLLGGVPLGQKAPDWALGVTDVFADPNTPNANRDNHFTVLDAREAMFRALTGTDKAGATVVATVDDRNAYWATTFRALGDVMHVIQDVSQPQHTRNDAHSGICGRIVQDLLSGLKSDYEEYIDNQAIAGNLRYSGYPVPVFNRYLDFFTTTPGNVAAGRGIADYSNRGFFTTATNIGTFRYALPSNDVNDTNIYSRIVETDSTFIRRAFLTGTVTDTQFPAQTQSGVKLTYESFFKDALDPLEDGLTAPYEYALNKAIYDETADLLIPRAVAYSTGMIDYFFRGRLEAENVSATDTTLSLNVRNATQYEADPANPVETLYSQNQNSFFVVAIRYTVNDIESVITSDRVTFSNDIAPDQLANETLTFSFASSVPANAENVEWRLVFRGRLGEEYDAVAVGRIEPAGGLIVTPSSLPADGIGGTRLITWQGSSGWQLGPENNLQGGNIDWKGWYAHGLPTQALSWSGPQARYFSTGNGSYSSSIFRAGVLYATAPGPVLGAALTKDSQSAEWLVAVCLIAGNISAYRAPAVDPDANWTFLDQLVPVSASSLSSQKTPWFFNGTGTEAQSVLQGITAGSGDNVYFRFKLSVGDGVASFQEMGAEPSVSQHIVIENVAPDPDYTYSGTYDFDDHSVTDSYIVAVDYIDGREIFASLDRSSGRSRHEAKRFDGIGPSILECGATTSEYRSLSGDSDYEQGERLTLSFGGKQIDLIRTMTTTSLQFNNQENSESVIPVEDALSCFEQFQNGELCCRTNNTVAIYDYSQSGNGSGEDVRVDEQTVREILFMDLRESMIVYYEDRAISDDISRGGVNYDVSFKTNPVSIPLAIDTGLTKVQGGSVGVILPVPDSQNSNIYRETTGKSTKKIVAEGLNFAKVIVTEEDFPFTFTENLTGSSSGPSYQLPPGTFTYSGFGKTSSSSVTGLPLTVRTPTVRLTTGSLATSLNRRSFLSLQFTDANGIVGYINELEEGNADSLFGISASDSRYYAISVR